MKKPTKLPTAAQLAAVGPTTVIPPFLLVKNRVPPTSAQQQRWDDLQKKLSRDGGGDRQMDWRKPKGMPQEEWDAFQADLAARAEERKRIALENLRERQAEKPKQPKIPGYKGHKYGSRKSKVHECFDEKGIDAAIALASKLGLKAGTAQSWLRTWGVPLDKVRKKKPTAKKKARGKKK